MFQTCFAYSQSFQSTPLWEGRHEQPPHCRLLCVSIHAPVGGATPLVVARRPVVGVQSTPLWEGRRKSNGRQSRRDRVSIHAPVGGATQVAVGLGPLGAVSIHAPVGGATWRRPRTSAPRRCFNPRPCGRGDAQKAADAAWNKVSIHAPVGGATCVNPDGGSNGPVSIHAPVGGATATGSAAQYASMFQSTPLWEGRLPRGGNSPSSARFNPRPCGRGDPV